VSPWRVSEFHAKIDVESSLKPFFIYLTKSIYLGGFNMLTIKKTGLLAMLVLGSIQTIAMDSVQDTGISSDLVHVLMYQVDEDCDSFLENVLDLLRADYTELPTDSLDGDFLTTTSDEEDDNDSTDSGKRKIHNPCSEA